MSTLIGYYLKQQIASQTKRTSSTVASGGTTPGALGDSVGAWRLIGPLLRVRIPCHEDRLGEDHQNTGACLPDLTANHIDDQRVA